MAEETKQEEKKTDSGKGVSTFFKFVLGLVFIGLGALAVYKWFADLGVVFRGCIGLFLILAGVITIMIAKE